MHPLVIQITVSVFLPVYICICDACTACCDRIRLHGITASLVVWSYRTVAAKNVRMMGGWQWEYIVITGCHVSSIGFNALLCSFLKAVSVVTMMWSSVITIHISVCATVYYVCIYSCLTCVCTLFMQLWERNESCGLTASPVVGT